MRDTEDKMINEESSSPRRWLILGHFAVTVSIFIVCFIWNARQNPAQATGTPVGILTIATGSFFAPFPLYFTKQSRVYVPMLDRTFVRGEAPLSFWCLAGILPLAGLALIVYGTTLIGQAVPRS